MKKIDFSFFKKNKREIYFSLIGFFLATLLIFLFVNSISFLIKKVNLALELKSGSSSFVRFNLEALKDLGLLNQGEGKN